MSIRWFDNDFTDPDIVASLSASSSQSAFPVSNIQTQRRSRVWRSNGYFVVSSDISIVFQETTSTDLTGTIRAGTYASASLMYAEVKTAMEGAAGSTSTYTITKDSTTQKMKIVSNGAGGGGILTLRWTQCTDAADLLGWDSGGDDSGELEYIADEIKIHEPSAFILWDFGISTNPSAFILMSQRGQGIKISPTATIKLEANETTNFTTPSYTTTLTYADFVMFKFASAASVGLHMEELRYWRVEITDPDNANGHVEVGAAFLGDWYETTQGQPQFGAGFDPEDRSINVFSEGGQTFGDERAKSETYSIKYKHLSIIEKARFQTIFETFGTTKPFFIDLDPDLVYLASRQSSIKQVKFVSEPDFNLENPGLYGMSVSLREEI